MTIGGPSSQAVGTSSQQGADDDLAMFTPRDVRSSSVGKSSPIMELFQVRGEYEAWRIQ